MRKTFQVEIDIQSCINDIFEKYFPTSDFFKVISLALADREIETKKSKKPKLLDRF